MKFILIFYRFFPLIIVLAGLLITARGRLTYRGRTIEGSDAVILGIVIMLLGVVYFMWDHFVVPNRKKNEELNKFEDLE
jgi:hypothetical protein